jgi:hypothetical protein
MRWTNKSGQSISLNLLNDDGQEQQEKPQEV